MIRRLYFAESGGKWVQADYKSGRTRRNFREKRNQAGTIQLTILKGLALSNLHYYGENLNKKRGMFCRIPRNVKL